MSDATTVDLVIRIAARTGRADPTKIVLIEERVPAKAGEQEIVAAWQRVRWCQKPLSNGWMHAERPAVAPTDPVLTPRLVLTPVGPDDVDDLDRLYSDSAVAYWTGPWTRAAVEAWATDMAVRWTVDGVGKWMARDRSDGSLIGRGGFTRFDLDGETVLELGWVVRDANTGRGYATELGRAALAWAVEHQPDLPIVAFTEVHNRASRAVMERLEMRAAGIIRREGRIEGRAGLHPDAPFVLYRLDSLTISGQPSMIM
jgi:RimJ/RimL family protein N-acetyltransferase